MTSFSELTTYLQSSFPKVRVIISNPPCDDAHAPWARVAKGLLASGDAIMVGKARRDEVAIIFVAFKDTITSYSVHNGELHVSKEAVRRELAERITSDDEPVCAICHEGTPEKAICGPCGHLFHHECLEAWENKCWEDDAHYTCPVCREHM
ncbi:hypothetical protein WJX72_005456 [[Myrmecia] bisecta]|uniref:RING-type domain-containing protein n=1 Tax=[Myrmecia] bisecta TaxID=41462 RepID=A0AAW1Q3P3_9CHLO